MEMNELQIDNLMFGLQQMVVDDEESDHTATAGATADVLDNDNCLAVDVYNFSLNQQYEYLYESKWIESPIRDNVITFFLHGCSVFDLPIEVLFMSTFYFDKIYQWDKDLEERDHYITACAAFWISSKYEQSKRISYEKLLAISPITYKIGELEYAEQQLCEDMDGLLNNPTTILFLKLYSKTVNSYLPELFLAEYFTLLVNYDLNMTKKYMPSSVAAGALILSRIYHANSIWPEKLNNLVGSNVNAYMELVYEINALFKVKKEQNIYINTIYSRKDKGEVATVEFKQIPRNPKFHHVN